MGTDTLLGYWCHTNRVLSHLSVTMTRFLMLVFLCSFLLQVTHQHPSKWKLVEMDSDELDDEGETGDTGAKDDLDDLAEAEQAPGNIAEEESSGAGGEEEAKPKKDEDNWDADWNKIPETARGHLGKEGPHMDVWDMLSHY